MYKCNKCSKRVTASEVAFLSRLAEITIEACFDGKSSISYRMLADYSKYVMFDEFRENFGTDNFALLPSCRYKEAVEFLAEWFPDDETMEESILFEDAFAKFIYQFCEEPDKDSKAYQQLMEDFINAVCTSSEGSCED